MRKHPDGSITLEKYEVQSVQKCIAAWSEAVRQLPSGEDVIGYDHYVTLHMWEDKFKGKERPSLLFYGFDEKEWEGKTVDQWLQEYVHA